jgi:peptide/nickel transport system ATP-binding protein/oligopeptide transport system ATP-binding protein
MTVAQQSSDLDTAKQSAAPRAPHLLEVDHLKKYFRIGGGLLGGEAQYVQAVDDVSFHIKAGETLSLVGESGCGKSTIGRTLMKLIQPTSGAIRISGTDIVPLDRAQMQPYRRQMQIIFQDPFSSLNPRMTAGDIVGEPLLVHNAATGSEREHRVADLFRRVGLRPDQIDKYPHEFSGGQRQRIGIARALALGPRLIVGDEPVSALDVSVQAQVINLLMDLQAEFGLSYLFIAHDLSVVKHISHRVAVMYLGRMVEIADSRALFQSPLHPYTEALLSAVPLPNPRKVRKQRIILKGDVPSPTAPPSGCRFHTRCPLAVAECKVKVPEMREINPGHWAACHLR